MELTTEIAEREKEREEGKEEEGEEKGEGGGRRSGGKRAQGETAQGSGGMPQWVRRLLCKRENQSLDPQHPCISSSVAHSEKQCAHTTHSIWKVETAKFSELTS